MSGGLRFRSVTSGDTHTCAIATDDSAYCWGANWDGRLGDGTNTNKNSPSLISGGYTFESLSAGGSHTCAVTAAAVAYCWGGNGNGQLGDGSTTLRKIPTRVATALRFQDLGAGKTPQTCAAAIDGTAYCWGWNFFGQLGNGTNIGSREPVRVSEP